MNNLSYWEKRKAWQMFHYMESAEKAADEISKMYLKASRYISLELDQIFERYMKKHKLSEAEAKRLLNNMKDKTSIDELKAALKSGSSDKTKAEILAELESPAYQARLERLEELQKKLDITMGQVYRQEKAQNTSHYIDLASEVYHKSIFEVQKRTGLGFGFNEISSQAIDRVINSKWSGKNYSTRIWNNTNALAQDLKEELLLNLVTGRTDREVAELITYKFAAGASQARRLVRTESCNLTNQMDMAAYKECGIGYYIYVATLDIKTSSICRSLDGKKFKVSEQRPGVNCPPMHPWCRSTTICNIDDEELSQMKRRARDPETGKTKTVPSDMTYEQWYKKNVKGKSEIELKEKKVKNLSADRKQHERYKEVLGKEVPETLDSFQKLKYTDIEKWKTLKQSYRDTNHYNKIIAESEKLNIKGKPIKNIDRIDLTEFKFLDQHINSERFHKVTKEQAQKYVNESVAAYSRWNGQVTFYISPNGAVIVNHKNKTVSTAYSAGEYDDKLNKLLEVLGID